MPLLVPKAAAVYLLKVILRQQTPSSFLMHLYSNNLLPDENSSLGSFTELTVAGYAALLTVPADWLISIVADGGGKAQYPPLQWNLLGACTVNGYFVTDDSGTSLAWAEKFIGGPIDLPIGGGIVEVSPYLQLF